MVSRILFSLRQKKIRIKELKFYYAGQRTKRQFLSGLVSAGFEVFVLIVDKKGRKIADTPENFAILIADLINEINLWYKIEKAIVTVDRHFHKKIDQDNFNKFLEKWVDVRLVYKIRHFDSQQNYLVNLADMTAGAVLWKYSGKDPQFYNLVKENIMIEKLIQWPEIKRKTINKKLTRTGACAHPSE